MNKTEKFGSKIELIGIGKKYEGRSEYTLKEINLTIESGEFLVILGPSGCGKTTLLRMIAGLNSITRGDLLFDKKRVNELEPGQRNISMVFQSYALYPHMNVYKNMAFGLEQAKIRKDVINQRVKDVAKILEIEEYLYDKPKDLSGGQRQRVAIGRAIVRKPKIFLMDEPLSNLDAKLRESMRRELVLIHEMLGTTSIYVTHDQLEAMAMATKIILMNKSIIQQIGTPKEMYLKPQNIFTAKFIGSPTINIIEGKILDDIFISNDKMLKISVGMYSKLYNNSNLKDISIGIRTEDFSLISEKDFLKNPENSLSLRIETVELLGKEQVVIGNIQNSKTILSINLSNSLSIQKGSNLFLKINVDRIHIFDTESTKRIN